MPKEKKKTIDEKAEKSTMFYYEIIGSIIIILSITTLGKLGKLGGIFTTLLKIMFGDWYFLILLFMLFLGLYNLFIHTAFNFRNNRFIGFIFFTLGLLLFSHFSVHKYVLKSDNSYITSTIDFYKNYINNYLPNNSSLGGGIIGAFFFYIIYLCLGTIGVILIGIIIIILSISLILNMSFFDVFKLSFSKLKNLKHYFKNFNNFFRYEVGKDIKSRQSNYIKIPLSVYKEINNIENNDEETKALNDIINKIFNENNIKFKSSKYIVSYYVTTFYFELYKTIDIIKVNNIFILLNKELNNEIFYNYENEEIIIQISNKIKKTLSVRKVLILEKNKNKFTLPIAIDYRNELYTLNINDINNICIIGSNQNEINNFIFLFLSLIFTKNKSNEVDIYMYDKFNNFPIFNNLTQSETDIYSFLDDIINKIDNWNEELSLNGLFDYKSYLLKAEEEFLKYSINKKIIIINVIKEDIDIKKLENDLLYISQLSRKLGLTLIYCISDVNYTSNLINGIFEFKILYKTNNELSSYFEYGNNLFKNSLYLEGSGDCFIVSKSFIRRSVTAALTKSDIENINNYIIKNIN